jgi:hypothetical protein
MPLAKAIAAIAPNPPAPFKEPPSANTARFSSAMALR